MNAVEKLLREGLERDPSDWAVRMELASKISDRGESAEAGEILAEAPKPPQSEEDLQQALDLAGDSPGAVRPLIESFVQENPSSSWAHHVLATIFTAEHDRDRAQKHFKTAVALDPDLVDSELEAYLTSGDEADAPEPEIIPVATATPLRPPEEANAGPDPETVSEASPESDGDSSGAAGAALAGDFDDDGELREVSYETVPIAYDPDDEHHRAIIVGEGEMVHAHDKTPDTSTKISAMATAILVHVGIIIALWFVVVSMPRANPPQLIASSDSTQNNDDMEQQQIERIQRRPSESSAAQMQVITSPTVSQVAVPDIQTENLTFDPIGVGDSFGMSMNFTDEDGAGMVSFFGSRSKAQKVIFVVDASASMSSKGTTGKAKFQLMKEELIKSLEALPPSVEYQVIFFSGPAWYVADGYEKKDWNQWTKNGKKLNFWEYKKGDPKDLPKGTYVQATKSKIRKTKKEIEELKMSYGTDWRAPLEMALGMKPDVVYFMTDGAVGKHPDKPEVVGHLVGYNKEMSNAKINTICLMQLKAFEDLKALADKTRGEFTLVLEDGTPLRGRDVEKMAGKKKKK